jgi:hypothetical protein
MPGATRRRMASAAPHLVGDTQNRAARSETDHRPRRLGCHTRDPETPMRRGGSRYGGGTGSSVNGNQTLRPHTLGDLRSPCHDGKALSG